MRFTFPIILSFCLLALAPDSLLTQDYLTKDGQLTKQLKVVQLQGGFAGFTGVQFTIAPDGSWTSERIFNNKMTPKNKGKLSEKDLAKLNALLKKYDLAKLPAKSGKQPGANPHTITFEFGNKKASLVGQRPPKLDPKDPTGTVESRFAGIWEGVVGLLMPPSSPKEKANVSTLIADEPKVHRGLAYADTKNERQMLDVYAPTEGKNHPVVVWIHGGGWRRGDKADVHNKPKAFVDRGFVLVSINYRFVPKVTVKQIAGDVANAIRWTHDHAKEYGGDPKRIIVMGHSAGAQLAALVCTDDRYLKAEGLPLSTIKACVPVDGDTYDVAMQIKTVEEKRSKSYKMTFGDAESQKDLSSVTHVAKGKNIPPFLILHVADHPETKAQSQRLVKVLQGAGISAKAYPAEGKNHTTINADLGLADDRPTQEMFGFLGAVLKK